MTLTACGGSGETDGKSNKDSNQSETKDEKKDTNKKYGVGDTAEVDGIKFTLKSVSTTDKRNDFADKDPKLVVKVEYEIENNSDSEIPIGADLQVYDGTGNQMESYPLDNTLGSLKPGKKIQGVQHFGIEEAPIEIYFQPTLSFGDEAVFDADVK